MVLSTDDWLSSYLLKTASHYQVMVPIAVSSSLDACIVKVIYQRLIQEYVAITWFGYMNILRSSPQSPYKSINVFLLLVESIVP